MERFRYQKFLSDIAGQDIKAHGNDPDTLIGAIRNWLNAQTVVKQVLPGKAALLKLYRRFQAALPAMLKDLQLKSNEVSFVDWSRMIESWLAQVAKV